MRHGTDLRGPRRRNFVLGGTGFVLLTAVIFWWQFSGLDGDLPAPDWNDLRWSYLPLLLLCVPLETLACGFRIWVIARVLEPGVRLSTCIRAEWAQMAVCTLTPTQSGGGPGQIYVMHREGARIGTAVTITMLSCLATMLAVLCLSLYALLAAGIDGSGRVLHAALWTSTGLATVMVLLAVPRAARRPASSRITRWLRGLLDTYRDNTARFLRRGKAAFAVVLALSLAFIVARAMVAYLVVRFMGIEGSTFRQILEVQIVVLLVEFVAPTPGGAGVVEGASLALMGAIVPPGHAPHYTLLWRFATLYLPALAGFVCLARALLEDARRLQRARIRPGPTDHIQKAARIA